MLTGMTRICALMLVNGMRKMKRIVICSTGIYTKRSGRKNLRAVWIVKLEKHPIQI
jgi:hypothetical protein